MQNLNLKIMLIDDDQTMVSLLTMLLNMEGYLVKTPRNQHMDGLLKDILFERPQVALVDVNLAYGNGIDLLREIRQEPEIKGTRILMCSGLNLREECIQAGADGFIQKPFMPDELINLIHANVNQ
jgi:DNA-binding response OmpR family regulator